MKVRQVYCILVFMARRAIPMIAFPWVQCMFIYILYVCGHLREYVLYT